MPKIKLLNKESALEIARQTQDTNHDIAEALMRVQRNTLDWVELQAIDQAEESQKLGWSHLIEFARFIVEEKEKLDI